MIGLNAHRSNKHPATPRQKRYAEKQDIQELKWSKKLKDQNIKQEVKVIRRKLKTNYLGQAFGHHIRNHNTSSGFPMQKEDRSFAKKINSHVSYNNQYGTLGQRDVLCFWCLICRLLGIITLLSAKEDNTQRDTIDMPSIYTHNLFTWTLIKI